MSMQGHTMMSGSSQRHTKLYSGIQGGCTGLQGGGVLSRAWRFLSLAAVYRSGRSPSP
jgi:hypothetical protein